MALRTWGGENQRERAEWGVIGEFGEVAEVYKKFLRGDFDEEEKNKRILKELGDSTYYYAISLYLEDKDISKVKDSGDYEMVINPSNMIFCVHNYIQYNYGDGELMELIQSICTDCGFTIEQVMQANIEKLADRAKRNKISGDGDER